MMLECVLDKIGDLGAGEKRKDDEMTKEERDLLIRDLCARLVYGVKVDTTYLELNGKICHAVTELDVETLDLMIHDDECVYIPYLRPMESMTIEERNELSDVPNITLYENGETISNGQDIDWMNERHLDYRGLIPMGLALPAKEGMYNN